MKPEDTEYFLSIKYIYIYIYIYIKYISIYYHYYDSSIVDIEHSLYYIALSSTHNHKVIYWQPTLSK